MHFQLVSPETVRQSGVGEITLVKSQNSWVLQEACSEQSILQELETAEERAKPPLQRRNHLSVDMV